jgi:hypothetical protein
MTAHFMLPHPASPNGFSSNDPKYILERLLVYRQKKSNGPEPSPSKASASPKTKFKASDTKKNAADDPASATAWRAELLFSHTGQPKAVLANAILALRKAPDWQSVLAYDEFALTTMAMRPPPWAKAQDNTWTPRHWTDRDDTLATEWMQREGISITVNTAATAAETVALILSSARLFARTSMGRQFPPRKICKPISRRAGHRLQHQGQQVHVSCNPAANPIIS